MQMLVLNGWQGSGALKGSEGETWKEETTNDVAEQWLLSLGSSSSWALDMESDPRASPIALTCVFGTLWRSFYMLSWDSSLSPRPSQSS